MKEKVDFESSHVHKPSKAAKPVKKSAEPKPKTPVKAKTPTPKAPVERSKTAKPVKAP
jgi:hypothetical protein